MASFFPSKRLIPNAINYSLICLPRWLIAKIHYNKSLQQTCTVDNGDLYRKFKPAAYLQSNTDKNSLSLSLGEWIQRQTWRYEVRHWLQVSHQQQRGTHVCHQSAVMEQSCDATSFKAHYKSCRGVILPTGAPKAAETPAAAPADTKSRFSVSRRKYSNICKHKKKNRRIYNISLNT